MIVDNSFIWVGFYKELANKLLPYKKNRRDLVKKVDEMYELAGIHMPKLEADNRLIDIDPFTFYGLFNKKLIPAFLFVKAGGTFTFFGILFFLGAAVNITCMIMMIKKGKDMGKKGKELDDQYLNISSHLKLLRYNQDKLTQEITTCTSRLQEFE